MSTRYENFVASLSGTQSISSTQYVAQTFMTIAQEHYVGVIRLWCCCYTTNTLTVSIRATDPVTKKPLGPNLITGTKTNPPRLDGEGAWMTFDLSGDYWLAASTLYAVIVTFVGASTFQASCNIYNLYPTGKLWASTDGATWSDLGVSNWDWLFEMWDFASAGIADKTIMPMKVSLELIRNVEVTCDGRFYISKGGNAVYESRYHRR